MLDFITVGPEFVAALAAFAVGSGAIYWLSTKKQASLVPIPVEPNSLTTGRSRRNSQAR